MGEFYAAHSANPMAGAGKPYPIPAPDPDNLIKNGGFELGNHDHWNGYEKRIISIDSGEPHEGVFFTKLRGGYSSAVSQDMMLEEGRTYRVTVNTRWSEAPGRSVSAALEKSGGTEVVRSPSFEETTWQETSFTYTATETTEHTFWIWTGPEISADLYIDSVSIRLE